LPAPRFTGLAVVDEMGIVPDGFVSLNLRAAKSDEERILILRKRFVAALSRFRPTVVVVGLPTCKSVTGAKMRSVVNQIAVARRLPVVHRPVVESRKLLLGRVGGNMQNALARHLIRGFFPGLVAWKRGTNSSRYRCHAFAALALCLHELALRAPLSAAALSSAEALNVCAWNEFLAEQTRNLYPQQNI
jgi:hypothetical protein